MKKYLFSFIVLLLITLSFLPTIKLGRRYSLYVNSQYGQYGQPSPSYYILVDKMVAKPISNKGVADYEYVDNLTTSDFRFRPSQEIYFKIKVKNISNRDITNVTIKDFVPDYLEPIEGPGVWNSQKRVITWNGGDFKINEEKIYYIKARIYSQDKLPADKGLFCLVNRAQAWFENTTDDDSSQFCIEKEVLGVSKVPSAGPEHGLILLAANILGASIGLRLRKKS